ncbi:MAG: ATP-binding protein [Thermoprotei archaeon]|nr:ATP-binding protein [Thermoprotei archaeon]
MSVLDETPKILRVLPALASIALALYVLNVISMLEALVLSLVLVAPTLAYVIWAKLPAGGFHFHPSSRAGGDAGAFYRVLDVEVRGDKREQAAASLAKFIGERASKGHVRYTVVSIAEGDYRRTLIILTSREPRRVDVEAEVLKTLLTGLVDGLRLSDVDSPEFQFIAGYLEKLGLSSKSALIVPDKALAERGQGSRNFRDDYRGLYLGEAIDRQYPRNFYLKSGDVEGHIGVFGSTGSGKSTTISLIAERTWRIMGTPVVILDWTGEHSMLLRSRGAPFKEYSPAGGEASINPLDLNRDPDYLVSVMIKALSLSPPQAYILLKALEASGPSNLRELEEAVESLPDESKWDREVKRALIRKIAMLTRGSYNAFRETRGLQFDGVSVIRLDYVKNVLARKSYALFFLAKLFMERSSGAGGARIMVVVDEAHNIFGGEEAPFIEQVFSESRKYGIHLVIATQSPASIPNGVLLNTNVKIVHALRSARDKSVIAETMSLPRDYVDILDKLGPGEAIVQSPSNPEPLLIQVQLVDEPGDELHDLGVYAHPIYADADTPRL